MAEFREPYIRRVMSGQARGPIAGLLRGGLRLAEWPYSAASRLRNRFFDRGIYTARSSELPVISVGNITVGGTGKTPFVQYLAGRLVERGHKVAVLSRGYGGKGGPNDESRVLSRHLGVGVVQFWGADRVALCSQAAGSRCDVVLLDDGFQHRWLVRDLDIVLIDALCPFGYGRVFPRGLLREALSGLSRADLLVITRADLVDPGDVKDIEMDLAERAPDVPVVLTAFRADGFEALSDRARHDVNGLKGRKGFCFCGVGNPGSFARLAEGSGIVPVGWRVFADHQDYTSRHLVALDAAAAKAGAELILTTEKDAVKLPSDFPWHYPLYALCLRTEVLRGQELLDRLVTDAVRLRAHGRDAVRPGGKRET